MQKQKQDLKAFSETVKSFNSCFITRLFATTTEA